MILVTWGKLNIGWEAAKGLFREPKARTPGVDMLIFCSGTSGLIECLLANSRVA